MQSEVGGAQEPRTRGRAKWVAGGLIGVLAVGGLAWGLNLSGADSVGPEQASRETSSDTAGNDGDSNGKAGGGPSDLNEATGEGANDAKREGADDATGEGADVATGEGAETGAGRKGPGVEGTEASSLPVMPAPAADPVAADEVDKVAEQPAPDALTPEQLVEVDQQISAAEANEAEQDELSANAIEAHEEAVSAADLGKLPSESTSVSDSAGLVEDLVEDSERLQQNLQAIDTDGREVDE